MNCTSYIISLSYPAKKMEYLKQYNVTPKFIKGINGKKLTNQSLVPDSVLGCALSHQLVWKTFLETNDDYAVIFEDDVVVENEVVETVNELINRKYDYDIILLGDCRYNLISKTIDDMLSEYNFTPGLHAYFINRQGAEKLLKETKEIWNHIDLQVQLLHYMGKIKKASLINRVAFQTSTINVGSSSQTKNTPILWNKLLQKIEVDKMVTLEYGMSVHLFKIFDRNISFNCILIFLFGYLTKQLHLIESIIIFLILFSADIVAQIEIGDFVFYFVLFMVGRLMGYNRK